MLSKLLKHDLKGIFKFLIIFYLLAIFFAILTRIFFSIDNSFIIDIIAQICTGATISIICSIVINNLMRIWIMFERNLYGDESYLTHTLPISKKELYTSKFISSFISLFTSTVVIALTLIVAYYSKENLELLKSFVKTIANVFDSSTIGFISSLVFILFIELFNALQSGYTGIILGHKKNSNKITYSVVYGLATYMFTQLFVLISIFLVAIFNSSLMNFFFTTSKIDFSLFKLLFVVCTIVYFIIIIALYFINIKILNSGVNVD